MSALAATSDASPALLALQRIEEHVIRAVTEVSEIKPPEIRYCERVAEIHALLQERFKCRMQPLGDETAIENGVVRFTGERKILTNGLRDAEDAYKDQIVSVLQSLSDRLVTIMDPSVIKRLLQNVSAKNLGQYLPDDLFDGDDHEMDRTNIKMTSKTGDQYHN